MTALPALEPRNSGFLGTVALVSVAVALGLLEGAPFALGAIVGAVGVAGSAAWRDVIRPRGSPWTVLPALVGLAVELVVGHASSTTELLAGATGVAFLLWVTDDPSRPAGGPRRAAVATGLLAVASGLSLVIVVAVPPPMADVPIAGGLLALALALLGVLLARSRIGAARA
jgi:hypothetical protein